MTHRLFVLLAAASMLTAVPRAAAVTHLHRGDVPPPVVLPDVVAGGEFTLASNKDHPVVLLFAELYHDASLEACRAVQAVLADKRVVETHALCVVIAAQQADAGTLRDAAQRRGVTLPVLHDRGRSVFAAYQVSVLPSVVVIDRKGLVVCALAGISPAFRDVLTDAILFADGQLTAAQFDRTINPASQPSAVAGGSRAARLTELARQLARGGMNDLAADKYREALAADPKFVPALVGLGRSALQQKRLPEAEQQFRAVLAIDAKSPEAAMGLIYVQTQRGGNELPKAEASARALLVERPNDPEAHFLLGMICEQSGRAKDAAAGYRKAAELLLQRGGHE